MRCRVLVSLAVTVTAVHALKTTRARDLARSRSSSLEWGVRHNTTGGLKKNVFALPRAIAPAAHAQRHAEARSLFFDHHQKLPVRVARPVIMRSSTT